MPFGNPVMAGKQIVRTVMQSANFVAGLAGWAIFRNGNAQFNQVQITGNLIGAQMFLYTGIPAAGNDPVFSITEGTADPFGNTVASGLATTGLPILVYS